MRIFRQGPRGLVLVVCATVCLSAALGQVTPGQVTPDEQIPGLPEQVDPSQAPLDSSQARPDRNTARRPLTPEEQRQKEIDKYDPLKARDTTLPGEAGAGAPDAATEPNTNPPASRSAKPLPGSVAESEEPLPTRSNRDGPQVVEGGDTSGVQTYSGPAVLSRSYTIARPMAPKEVKWSWNVGSSEIYQSGLVAGVTTPGAAATSGSAFGTATNFSFSGRHFFKKDQIGAHYSVSYTNYIGANAYNGANQNLSLDYGHAFSRRLLLNLVETGSILSMNSTLENPLTAPGVSVANLSLAASPSAQLLDLTTRQTQTQLSLTWQQSARLSFNLSGGFFAVDFTGPQLQNSVGYQSQADVNYRYTSRMTVGAYYSFTDYVYTKHESVSNSNTIGLIYSYAFDRRTQLRLRAGVTRIESLAFTVVPVSPVFAALTGEANGIVDAYHLSTISDLSGQLVRDFGHSRTGNVSFARGITPGNGLILTSVQETLSAGFSTALFRRFVLGFSGMRTVLSAQNQNVGSYTTNTYGLILSRSLPRGATASLGVNYVQINVTNMPGLQSQFRITSGVSWGPGPGRLW